MTVGELKEILAGVEDSVEVVVMGDGTMVLSASETGLCQYDPDRHTIRRWVKDFSGPMAGTTPALCIT